MGVDRVVGGNGRVVVVVELTGGGTAAIVNVDTIDGVGSKASTFGSSAPRSGSVVAAVAGAGPAMVVDVDVDVDDVSEPSCVAGAMVVDVVVVDVDVVDSVVVDVDVEVVAVDDEVDAGTVVVVVVVVSLGLGRIGSDSALLRPRSSPAHCFVPSWNARTSRSSSTSLAVRVVGSSCESRASGVPPTVAVER